MALTIEQQPKYNLLPVGQEIIYTIYDNTAISGNYKIKYIAEVYINNRSSNLTATANRVAVLKATPNSTGRGIFDLRSILENYVSPDYEGGVVHNSTTSYFSQYNSTDYSDTTPHTIHQIDNFSTNRNSVRYVKVRFKIEYATSATGTVTTAAGDKDGNTILIFNGVLYDTDIFKMDINGKFGFHLGHKGLIMNSSGDKFLTNAPTTQYIRLNDYMTLPFFSQYDDDFRVGNTGISHPSIHYIKIQFYYNGSTTGSLITKTISPSTGGHSGYMSDSNNKLQFAGVGTGNLVGSGETLPTNWEYYTVVAHDRGDNLVSDTYKIYKQEDDCKGYETIRLTWLNKWGTWDYYNFTKRSTRQFTINRKSYKQINGTWNESKYKIQDHKGGAKYFGGSITEQISINTDYITESEAQWLEELFISTDVYILNQRSTDSTDEGYLRKYIEPVTITDKALVRKTKANDKLLQYAFKLTKTRTKKTHRI
tara:strand:- start:305 stop:1744 length:1440 start_codon:yes stop_codon:yes gene_type:complete